MGTTGTRQAYEFPTGCAPPLGQIRAWLREQLSETGRITIADTELLTTELVTNAHEHADGAAELRVFLPSGRDVVRVEVDDRRPHLRPCRPAKPDPTSPHGRGLALVEAISTEWGVDTGEGYKTVWAEIPVL
ncbi:ATP-binding protein [Amycolatopsis alba]|uniref:ATP-binding protein n=1 Tax=Amycolatopsis alba DSM 44262 TaxID=1125972 RepID=A0A229RUU8_AMYAL|nr:ATP-binding protein [Amycolatopsis alba]OXM50442.1 ATP-binding protein [Amycolatopsis alba DSM 44262]